MSPAQIGFLDRGAPKWVTQRPKPFTNCMFASVCVPLSFMGYDLPDDFVDRLRAASGVDVNKPTSTAATLTALKQLIPDCPIVFGGLEDQDMLRRIEAGDIVVRVMLRVQELPNELSKHFKPGTAGGHAVALAGAKRLPDGDFNVLWLDPMGRPKSNYRGLTARYSTFKQALMRTPTNLVRVTYGRHNAALPETADEVDRGRTGPFVANPLIQPPPNGKPIVLTRGRPNEFATIPKGTPFLHPADQSFVTRAAAKGDFRLAGRSTDGRFAGVWVNTRRVPGARGLSLLIVDRELIGPPFPGPG